MKVNEVDPDVREFLYYRFNEQQEAADIDFNSPEMKAFRKNLDVNIFTAEIKYHYSKYAPSIQACLDKARKITEDHWHVKIEWE
ncbi:hypothetical protein RA086_05565 [Lactiplantibacillus sp. WILCCON 0030]|uniref:Uncharacterized protein n=1 Tax=Lactiplantibacillus brownii TaxID=3069269 RepID=A0ABU1A832_9LACO|nr:hypothetical protein [Lactiplantibacillus brownii]MDQ7937094.1 hypothetical protein [Lactiplantibacillus brownii]